MCTSPRFIHNHSVVRQWALNNFKFDKFCLGGIFYSRPIFNSENTDIRSGLMALSFDEFGRCTSPKPQITTFIDQNYIIINGCKLSLYIASPCGRCAECLYSKRNNLRVRSIIHAHDCKDAIFFTLTYDDKNLPECGLYKPHVSSFFKRLRRRLELAGLNLAFNVVYCGEYGVDPRYTRRPHYHGIMYFYDKLTLSEFRTLRQLFTNQHKSCFKIDKYGNKRLTKPVWRYGRRFDFQRCKNVIASSAYITKYITKQYLYPNSSKYSAPCFFQTPRQISIGCTNLDYWKKLFEESKDGCVIVKNAVYNSKTQSYKICYNTITMPPQMFDKIYKTPSRLCPAQAFNTLRLVSALRAYDLRLESYLDSIPEWPEQQVRDIVKKLQYGLIGVSLRRSQKKELDFLRCYVYANLDAFQLVNVMFDLVDMLSSAVDAVTAAELYLQRRKYKAKLTPPNSNFINETLPARAFNELNSVNSMISHDSDLPF